MNVASPLLAKHGFQYSGKPDKASWRYQREHSSVLQFITFVKSVHTKNALRVEFSSSKNPSGIEGRLLVPGRERIAWWTYGDDDELVRLVHELCDLAIDKGIPWLDSDLAPLFEPTEDDGRLLLPSPEDRARSFAQDQRLDITDPSSLGVVERLLVEQRCEAPPTILILGAAAYVGEVIRITLGGEWAWDSGFNTPAVVGIGGKTGLKAFPLRATALYWSRPNDPRFGLMQCYRNYSSLIS